MEEFIRGVSRLELLKRGALGAAAIGGADALLRSGTAGAATLAPQPGRQARRRHRPGLRGHQRPDRLRLPLGPADGLRHVRHVGQVRLGGAAQAVACDEMVEPESEDDDRHDPPGREVPQRQAAAGGGRRLEPQPHPRPGQAGVQQLPRPAEGHLGQGSQDQRHAASDHDQEADADGRELPLLVHHAGERRRPEPRRQADRHRAFPVQELRQGRPARARAVPGLLERRPSVPERADLPLRRRRGGASSPTSSRATSSTCTTSRSRRCRRCRASGTPS